MARLDEILPWFTHNAGIHFSAPHGLEQYGGAAWGVRDVCQGSVEWLLAAGEHATVRRVLVTVFARQYPSRRGMAAVVHASSVSRDPAGAQPWRRVLWPVKALCDYVEATNELDFLSEEVGYTDPERGEPTGPRDPSGPTATGWWPTARRASRPERRLINYGDGDWDDTLQPADPAMRTRMVSAWTVALAYQMFRQLRRSAGGRASARASRLDALLERMRADFHAI